MSEMRPVRVFLAIASHVLLRTLKEIVSSIMGQQMALIVDDQESSDIIIFVDPHTVADTYDSEKKYVFLKTTGQMLIASPPNCTLIHFDEAVTGIYRVVLSMSKKLQPIVEMPPVAPLIHGAHKILVVDDSRKNIASARVTLAGHDLTTVTSYPGAMDLLKVDKFDVVLTDLYLPMSHKTLGEKKFRLGESVPYGIFIALQAALFGSKYVAIVTDTNHHEDPVSAAFDEFTHIPIVVENSQVLLQHARLRGDGSKDWAHAMSQLLIRKSR